MNNLLKSMMFFTLAALLFYITGCDNEAESKCAKGCNAIFDCSDEFEESFGVSVEVVFGSKSDCIDDCEGDDEQDEACLACADENTCANLFDCIEAECDM